MRVTLAQTVAQSSEVSGGMNGSGGGTVCESEGGTWLTWVQLNTNIVLWIQYWKGPTCILRWPSHKVLLCGPQAAECTTGNFVPPKFMSGFFRLIESQQKEIDGSLFFKQSRQCDIMSHLSFIKCKWKRTNSVCCKADDSETLTATVWWHHHPVLQLAPTSRFAGSFPSTLWKEKPKAWTFVFALTSAYDDYTRSNTCHVTVRSFTIKERQKDVVPQVAESLVRVCGQNMFYISVNVQTVFS